MLQFHGINIYEASLQRAIQTIVEQLSVNVINVSQIRCISATGALANIDSVTITVLGNPSVPTIARGTDTLYCLAAATTYQWYLNGQQISGATNQTYTTTQSGNYLVRTTDSNGCVYVYSTTLNHTQVPAAVVDINFSDKLNVYPNPTQGLITIKNASLFGKEYSIQVIDPSGRIIQTHYNATTVDISSLHNGYYFIKLVSPEGSFTKKVLLNK